MSNAPNTPAGELLEQWSNPGDILSLLLLIGGDIVQKAIAQLSGYYVRPLGRYGPSIPLTPVAFSFGWVAFGFTSLMSAVGGKRLMPEVEKSAIVVNCANSFVRENQSWLLERLLRDHESAHELDKDNDASFRIDIFELGSFSDDEQPRPELDLVWWLGWVTILAQIGLATVPWALYGDWGAMMILLCGTTLAFITSSLSQWRQEKWSGSRLDGTNVNVLTRGNGYRHMMVFLGTKGSYNLEIMATADSKQRPETTVMTVSLAILWSCLLICTSGLKANAWFLVGSGVLGMAQNVYAAGRARPEGTTGLKIRKFARKPTILGNRLKHGHEPDADVDLDKAAADVATLEDWLDKGHGAGSTPEWLKSMSEKDGTPDWLRPVAEDQGVVRTHGALKELEKWVPGAGFAMLKIFFPGSLDYDDKTIKYNVDKKFWKRAWHTKSTRRRAEQARRANERPIEAAAA